MAKEKLPALPKAWSTKEIASHILSDNLTSELFSDDEINDYAVDAGISRRFSENRMKKIRLEIDKAISRGLKSVNRYLEGRKKA